MEERACFYNGEGKLCLEGVVIADIVREVGTPTYIYSQKRFCDRLDSFQEAFPAPSWTVCYAMKANAHLAFLRIIAEKGGGCDVVSSGEIQKALKAGVKPGQIIFSGVGKSEEELQDAIRLKVGRINIESESELRLLADIAGQMGKEVAKPAITIRVNPDIEAGTHDKISTGRKHDKFGLSIEDAYRLYADFSGHSSLVPTGLAVHIGSQITNLAPFEAAFAKLAGMIKQLRAEGHKVTHIDIGGGRASGTGDALPPLSAYAALAEKYFPDMERAIEPGRSIVAQAGLLAMRVLHIKQEGRMLIVDAGMNDFMRPALYDARHDILPMEEKPSAEKANYVVAGPVCESADVFSTQAKLPTPKPGDGLVLCDAGAYGMAMASHYNGRPFAAEILVAGGQWAVISPREKIEDIWRDEAYAPWQGLQK